MINVNNSSQCLKILFSYINIIKTNQLLTSIKTNQIQNKMLYSDPIDIRTLKDRHILLDKLQSCFSFILPCSSCYHADFRTLWNGIVCKEQNQKKYLYRSDRTLIESDLKITCACAWCLEGAHWNVTMEKLQTCRLSKHSQYETSDKYFGTDYNTFIKYNIAFNLCTYGF